MKSPLVCLAVATVAFFLAASDGYDGWEKTWRRKWLTPAQEDVAKQRMNDALVVLDVERKENLAKQDTLDNKYSLVEFRTSPIKQRLAPLCKLFTVKPWRDSQKVTIDSKRDCTCFFVKPDVVMTDAHCIFPMNYVDGQNGKKEKWVAVDVKPENRFVTFIVRLYGMEAENADAHKITTRMHAQHVVEWWTPDQFGYKRWEVDKVRGLANMDVAFLKVRNPVPASKHLILTQPEGPLGGVPGAAQCNFLKSPSAVILGYPAAYKNGAIGHLGDTLGRNWWFTKGSVGSGASGGPIVMGLNSAGMPPECDMGVFGNYNGGYGPDDKLRRNYSPLITKQLIQALNLIAKVPVASDSVTEGVKMVKKCDVAPDSVTEGFKVMKKCDDSCACDVRSVELSLT